MRNVVRASPPGRHATNRPIGFVGRAIWTLRITSERTLAYRPISKRDNGRTAVVTVSAFPRIVLSDVDASPAELPLRRGIYGRSCSGSATSRTPSGSFGHHPIGRPRSWKLSPRVVGSEHRITRQRWETKWELAVADVVTRHYARVHHRATRKRSSGRRERARVGGLGRNGMPHKIWAVGEEVLAADFQTYLQNQTVPQFPNVAARNTWVAPPKGALCVTTDTNAAWIYNGSVWGVFAPNQPRARVYRTTEQGFGSGGSQPFNCLTRFDTTPARCGPPELTRRLTVPAGGAGSVCHRRAKSDSLRTRRGSVWFRSAATLPSRSFTNPLTPFRWLARRRRFRARLTTS